MRRRCSRRPHPEWSAGQLKDLLASTALTKDGLDVFAQGSGRVDVARASAQHVFGTGSVSLGILEQPGAAPVTRPITYTNTSGAPVTLDLAAGVTNLTTGQAVTDGIGLSASRLTVPAGGTAEAGLTLDPTKVARGKYSGWVTATGPAASSSPRPWRAPCVVGGTP